MTFDLELDDIPKANRMDISPAERDNMTDGFRAADHMDISPLMDPRKRDHNRNYKKREMDEEREEMKVAGFAGVSTDLLMGASEEANRQQFNALLGRVLEEVREEWDVWGVDRQRATISNLGVQFGNLLAKEGKKKENQELFNYLTQPIRREVERKRKEWERKMKREKEKRRRMKAGGAGSLLSAQKERRRQEGRRKRDEIEAVEESPVRPWEGRGRNGENEYVNVDKVK